jgi:hypothetical protein
VEVQSRSRGTLARLFLRKLDAEREGAIASGKPGRVGDEYDRGYGHKKDRDQAKLGPGPARKQSASVVPEGVDELALVHVGTPLNADLPGALLLLLLDQSS